MLNLTQGYSATNKDGSLQFHKAIPAVAFAYGPLDEIEEKQATVSYKDTSVTPNVQKKNSVTIERVITSKKNDAGEDVAVISKHAPTDLYNDAIAYFKAAYPDQDAVLTLLDRASVGENAAIKISNKIKPPVDKEAVILKTATDMFEKGLFKSLDKALIAVRAMLEDDDEVTETPAETPAS